MDTTTLNPEQPTTTLVIEQTLVTEVKVPDVDLVLDEAFSHLARHLGEQQAVIDSALELIDPLDIVCSSALNGYLEALEDVTALMGQVRASH